MRATAVRWAVGLLVVVPALVAAADAPAPADAIVGFWRTDGGGAVVEIRPSGDTYTGRLVWLRESRYPADDPRGIGGQPVTDRHNPDPAARDRPLLGLELLTGLSYAVEDGEARWRGGRIYDTENGKRYDCNVRLVDHDHLKLHGYIGIPLLGRTTTWTRVADPDREEST